MLAFCLAVKFSNDDWATWVGADPVKQLEVYERVKSYTRRPVKQLDLTAEA